MGRLRGIDHFTGLTHREWVRFIPGLRRERSTMDSVVASEAIDPGSTPGTRTNFQSAAE